jgi:hypothetical protein
MSMEIYVLSDQSLTSMAEWQDAIKREGIDLRLDDTRPLEDLGGHLPAYRGNDHAGFECNHFKAAEITKCYSDVDFGHPWTKLLAFRWGGDELALWGAFAAAAAYARATRGIVFDPESGDLLSPDRALEVARSVEQSLPKQP